MLCALEKVASEKDSLCQIQAQIADPNGKHHPFSHNKSILSVADGHWECEGPLLKEIVERERNIMVKKYSTLLKQAVNKGTTLPKESFKIDDVSSEFTKLQF